MWTGDFGAYGAGRARVLAAAGVTVVDVTVRTGPHDAAVEG